ncbi:MAG: hypothetical protein KIH08_15560, partial [Candidatus Freyarchaeota archaeon]|nr:hypothetical protein [Candidatus Jordarchaeia archaeon]
PGMKIHKNRGLNALSPSKPPQKVNTKEYKNQNVIKGRLVVVASVFFESNIFDKGDGSFKG